MNDFYGLVVNSNELEDEVEDEFEEEGLEDGLEAGEGLESSELEGVEEITSETGSFATRGRPR